MLRRCDRCGGVFWSGFSGASVNPFKSAVVCVAVIAICGCDDTSSQPQAPPTSDVGESQVINEARKPSKEQVNEWANKSYDAVRTGSRADAFKYFRLAAMNGHIDAAQQLENQLGRDDIAEAYAWGGRCCIEWDR